MPKSDWTILLLGAGVQSSTIVLMGLAGDIELPDCAIFADTGWEPKAVYTHLAWLEAQVEGKIPIYRVSAGNIRDDVLASLQIAKFKGRIPRLPFFTTPEGNGGIRGMLRRTCTINYKIEPSDKKIRELVGLKKRQRWPKGVTIEKWFGISLDEAQRMRSPDAPYVSHRYPLIDLRMRRGDCVAWLTAHGYAIPPKSACIGCCFHNDRMWRELKDGSPEEWADAVAFDAAIRTLPGLVGGAYLHGSLIPLDRADLRTDAERGQQDLFGNECTGLCGV